MVSAHRDLRTGTPVWEAYGTPVVATHRLKRDVKCDVLVVGAGVTGALTGELLAADGHKVVIVDRRGPFRGSTSANTALILYEIDVPLSQLARKIGEHQATRAWRRSFLALHSLAARTRFLGIRCNLADRRSIYLAGNVLNPAGLRRELKLRAAAGFHSSYLNNGS